MAASSIPKLTQSEFVFYKSFDTSNKFLTVGVSFFVSDDEKVISISKIQIIINNNIHGKVREYRPSKIRNFKFYFPNKFSTFQIIDSKTNLDFLPSKLQIQFESFKFDKPFKLECFQILFEENIYDFSLPIYHLIDDFDNEESEDDEDQEDQIALEKYLKQNKKIEGGVDCSFYSPLKTVVILFNFTVFSGLEKDDLEMFTVFILNKCKNHVDEFHIHGYEIGQSEVPCFPYTDSSTKNVYRFSKPIWDDERSRDSCSIIQYTLQNGYTKFFLKKLPDADF